MAAPPTLLSRLTIAEETEAAEGALLSSLATVDDTAAEGAPPLHLFNSKTKKKELFVPQVEGEVAMYVCDVTPYDSSHVGHARAYVAFDVLFRYLKFLGYKIRYVRNFTDVDDKIIERAKLNGETFTSLSSRFIDEFHADMEELQCLPPTDEPRVTEHIDDIIELVTKIIERAKLNGETFTSLSSRFIDEFHADMEELQCLPPTDEPRVTEHIDDIIELVTKIIERAKLNGETFTSLSSRFIDEFHADMEELQCLPPTDEPRVTEHIDDIIELVTKIIKNDKGYDVDGDVYFSVDSFPEYYSLSGRKQEDNRAGSRVDVDPKKRGDPDFALWKAAKEGEPSWESPWGDGRPGWHVECSAMSARYLGHVIDIHGGGEDLIFPHHENELAQCRAAYPESEVKCWMHNGFINNRGEKMLKSANNFSTIRSIITRYHPLALRFFLMRTHYKSDMNHSDKLLEIASDRVYYIYQNISVPVPAEEQKLVDDHHKGFLESMSDDLRTTDVLDGFMELLKAINRNLNDLKKLQQKLEQQKKKQQQKKQQQEKQQKPQIQPEDHIQALAALSAEIKSKLSILGLMPLSPLAEELEQLKVKALTRAGLTEESLREQIEQRVVARNKKQFDVSDQIRKGLARKGIALMDEPIGTVWRPCERE